MKKIVLAMLVIMAVVGVGVGMGGSNAFAECNPWVRQCLNFRTMDTQPLLDGARAGHQECYYLGCGW
ncbi:MAG TPA: hypothetical protein VGD95_03465 [Micavibrio sp.]